MTDIVTDIHNFDLGAFETPEKALAQLACLADDAADEIERLRQGEKAADAEIERLRSELTKWKARAQVMREWMDCEQIDVAGAPYAWDEFVNDKPEAAAWFDEEGAPR